LGTSLSAKKILPLYPNLLFRSSDSGAHSMNEPFFLIEAIRSVTHLVLAIASKD